MKKVLNDISVAKKELFLMRLKASSGDQSSLKTAKEKRNHIANLYTKIKQNQV